MSILDLNDFENGVMDKYVENRDLLKRIFGKGECSSVLIMTKNCPFQEIAKDLSLYSKYIDLEKTVSGDYIRFMAHIEDFGYDGLFIDNVDKIPDNDDREYWEYFVKYALRNESDFQPRPFGSDLELDKKHNAARCSAYPEYLKGMSVFPVLITDAD